MLTLKEKVAAKLGAAVEQLQARQPRALSVTAVGSPHIASSPRETELTDLRIDVGCLIIMLVCFDLFWPV